MQSAAKIIQHNIAEFRNAAKLAIKHYLPSCQNCVHYMPKTKCCAKFGNINRSDGTVSYEAAYVALILDCKGDFWEGKTKYTPK